MLTPTQQTRYSRTLLLNNLTGGDQQRLLDARVFIIGAGGLGSHVAAALAGMGVGHITVADPDKLDLSNLHRQTLYRTEDIGKQKTDLLGNYITNLNPEINYIGRPVRAETCFSGQYDLLIDGSDTISTRLWANRMSIKHAIPLVSAAVKHYDAHLYTFKGYTPDNPCYQCLFPHIQSGSDDRACTAEGVLGPIVAAIAHFQAIEALKELLHIGDSLAGSLLVYNALTTTYKKITLPKDPSCPACKSE